VVVVTDGVISKNCQEVHESARFNSFHCISLPNYMHKVAILFFRATRVEAGEAS
jgi:hypothetical protein